MSSGTSLKPLWAEARRAIAVAEEVVVIGYSFPPTDAQAAGLLDATGMDFIMDALVGLLESEGDTGLNQRSLVSGRDAERQCVPSIQEREPDAAACSAMPAAR